MKQEKGLPAGGQGFTLTEILIVIALIMLIALMILANIRNQVSKAHDVQRKADLSKIQKAMEEYYNDAYTYPPSVDAFSNCGGTDLAPYLTKILCDPITKEPYYYVLGTPTAKDGYIICAQLQNRADPDIVRIGCDPVKGCGWKVGYNYCLASGMLAISEVGMQNPGGAITGTPTPTVAPGEFACTPKGDCKSYANPSGFGCPYTYLNAGCYGMCADPANRCKH